GVARLCRRRRVGKIQPSRKRSGQGGRCGRNRFSPITGGRPRARSCHSRGNEIYLTSAIAIDWPAMESGTQSSATTEALNEIYHPVLKLQSLGTDERLVLAEMLRQVDRISEARRERRVMADGIVPAIIWVVLFGGAFLTVGFTFFFGAKNLRAQS